MAQLVVVVAQVVFTYVEGWLIRMASLYFRLSLPEPLKDQDSNLGLLTEGKNPASVQTLPTSMCHCDTFADQFIHETKLFRNNFFS